jgi:probable F420-dependent oxidoreductase
MRVETHLTPNLEKTAEAARRAEALGFDGLLATELNHNPFFPLAIAAEHTRRVQLATGVALAFPHSPTAMAQVAWELQGFSKGRFELGLGTQVKGHIERRFGMTWTAPGPRLRDYIGAMRAVWETWATGKPLKYQSEHYNLSLMTPNFMPERIEHPNIRVCIAAVGDYMCRLAGELCDGIRLHGFCTPKYLAEVILPNIEKGLAKSGRPRRDFTVYGGGFFAVGTSLAEIDKAVQAARRQISFYSSTRTYHPVLEVHGWKDFGNRMHEMSLRGEWDAMAEQVPDEMVDAFAITGTYDQIVGQIQKRLGGLVDSIRLVLPPPGSPAEGQLPALLAALHAT